VSFIVQSTDSRRSILVEAAVALAIALATALVLLASVPPALAATAVPFAGVAPGTVVVRQGERRLYLAMENGRALAYPVAVGRPGRQWRGVARIDGKYVDPAWAPPAVVKRAEPWLPAYIPGGAPNNPMGHRALTLSGGQYAIHGTNRPSTVGTAASYGCIRMREADIEDLFARVAIGTPVVMVR
jgi:lipoprotein-anchoring transpeptidase ErfK/SrfK